MSPSDWGVKVIDAEQERRLLEKADREAIACAQGPDGRWFTSSATSTEPHPIGIWPFTCNCTGFWRWGICKHVARVRDELVQKGLAVRCSHCNHLFKTPLAVEAYEHLVEHDSLPKPSKSRKQADDEPTL